MQHQPAIHGDKATRRSRRVDVYVAALALVLASCQAQAPRKDPLELPGLLVGTAWLERHMPSGEVVLLDTRPRAEYDQGHLPGAISLPTQTTFDVDNSNRLPPVPVIETLLGRSGITHEKAVVVYDQDNMRWAARSFWMLEVHGHTKTALLDGGLSRWIQEGRPISVEEALPEPTVFIANVLPERLATKLDTFQAIGRPGTVIIDTRSASEYSGMEERWPRNGHIPGAVNIEWTRNLATSSDTTAMKPIEEIRGLYDFEPGTRFVTYCTRGRRAAITYLALRRLGFESAVYDGSWSEWAADTHLPVKSP